MSHKRLSYALLLAPYALVASDLPETKQGKEASGLVNPSSRFEVSNGWNFFTNVEFLYWTAKQDGLYYAQNGLFRNDKIFDGHLAKVHPQFRPGFRIGLGGNMGYDDWDIRFTWTWFKSTAHGSKNGMLLPLWGYLDITNGNVATHAKGQWHLLLNLFDTDIGRSFWVGKHLSLRPFIGIRGAWINQHFRTQYDLATAQPLETKTKALSDFDGGGLRLGADLRFALLGGWSIYSQASGSLLYGYYDCDYKSRVDGATYFKSGDGFRQAASNGQLEIGFRWDGYFAKDRYHLGLYGGWEQNIWFGLNKMNHFFGPDYSLHEQMNGDLTLSGGTFGVRFDF